MKDLREEIALLEKKLEILREILRVEELIEQLRQRAPSPWVPPYPYPPVTPWTADPPYQPIIYTTDGTESA